MKTAPQTFPPSTEYAGLTAAQLLDLLAAKDEEIEARNDFIQEQERAIRQRDCRIELLEEQLRLSKIQKFLASSEKHILQLPLFDETELEAALAELKACLGIEDDEPDDKPARSATSKKRKRGFSASLARKRIELLLTEAEKAGASRVFLAKIKEELSYIPAKLEVVEYWQEKAVFTADDDAAEQAVEASFEEFVEEPVVTISAVDTGDGIVVDADNAACDDVVVPEDVAAVEDAGLEAAADLDEAALASDLDADGDSGEQGNGDDAIAHAGERIVSAARPVNPLGKCIAHPTLLAYILVSKYADGLPLYRLEGMFKRHGQVISRTLMANWMIRLEPVLRPLMNLMREAQNSGDYLQADETRIQVLKEDGKTAQSDKWMWVIRGGPPGQPSVLFHYDPSRSGEVALRLLDGFKGVLQADGYSGYAAACEIYELIRIGCWDHVRRYFVDAARAAPTGKNKRKRGDPTKADMALSYIGRLYAIERKIADYEPAQKREARQQLSVPVLNEFKAWLDKQSTRVLKGSLTRKAIDYALNQWQYLTGYCEDGRLNISNALAENAIRPFAVGRRAWLFADTSRGAHASATCYSLIETAKANGLEPYAYVLHVLERIGAADTLETIEALLPWNVDLPRREKK